MTRKETPRPFIASFAVTAACNLKCRHCYSTSGSPLPDELSTEEALSVVEQLAALGVRLLIFDGGEPLLRKDLPQLVARARDAGLRPVLGTNGWFLSAEEARRMKDSGLQAVQISLDGAEAAMHDAFRGVEGSFERVLAAARNCTSAGLDFQIAPTVHRKNFEQWEAIVAIAKQLGANAVETFEFVPSGRALGNAPEYALSQEQRRLLLRRVTEAQKKDPDFTHRLIGVPQYYAAASLTVDDDLLTGSFVRSCCAAGTRYLTIMPDGEVLPCMVLPVSAGRIREQPLEKIWKEAEVFRVLRDPQGRGSPCGECRFSEICGGARCRIYAATGSLCAGEEDCLIPAGARDAGGRKRGLREMEWDQRAWEGLRDATSPMPIFVRRRALTKLVRRAEEAARRRGASRVELEDLLAGIPGKAGGFMQEALLDALRSRGMEV